MQIPTLTNPAPPSDQSADGVSQATSRVAEFGQRAGSAIDDKKDSLVSGIDAAASTLRDKADTLPGGERVASAAYATADAIENAADYLADHDIKDIFSDVRQMVKKNPGSTLVAAAALGFLLARTFSRR